MPKTILVGLPDAAVKESTHRVERAIVDGATHVDILNHSPVEYRDRVIKFLRSHLHVGVEVVGQRDVADLQQITDGS